jgi:hypothetical protein
VQLQAPHKHRPPRKNVSSHAASARKRLTREISKELRRTEDNDAGVSWHKHLEEAIGCAVGGGRHAGGGAVLFQEHMRKLVRDQSFVAERPADQEVQAWWRALVRGVQLMPQLLRLQVVLHALAGLAQVAIKRDAHDSCGHWPALVRARQDHDD